MASERERRRRRFVKMLEDNNLTTQMASGMLHSSEARVSAWRREEGSKGSNPVPEWAIELLAFKLAMTQSGRVADMLKDVLIRYASGN